MGREEMGKGMRGRMTVEVGEMRDLAWRGGGFGRFEGRLFCVISQVFFTFLSRFFWGGSRCSLTTYEQ
jgi:hypothetical protein